MTDAYFEQIVKRKLTPKLLALKILVFLLAAFVIYTLIGLFLTNFQTFSGYGAFFAFILFAIGWLCWRWSVSMNLEFEYIVTNGELDIDKIIAQRKRKRAVTIHTNELEQMAPYDDANRAAFDSYECTATIDAVGSGKAGGIWYITANTRQYGKVRVLFQPCDRIVENMRTAMPRKVLTRDSDTSR